MLIVLTSTKSASKGRGVGGVPGTIRGCCGGRLPVSAGIFLPVDVSGLMTHGGTAVVHGWFSQVVVVLGLLRPFSLLSHLFHVVPKPLALAATTFDDLHSWVIK